MLDFPGECDYLVYAPRAIVASYMAGDIAELPTLSVEVFMYGVFGCMNRPVLTQETASRWRQGARAKQQVQEEPAHRRRGASYDGASPTATEAAADETADTEKTKICQNQPLAMQR